MAPRIVKVHEAIEEVGGSRSCFDFANGKIATWAEDTEALVQDCVEVKLVVEASETRYAVKAVIPERQ